MDWNKFKNKFHRSWHSYVKPFIESEKCDKIYNFLRSRKKEITPKSILTFRAFQTNLDNIKCVILLDEPYHTKYQDVHYADGVPLSCEYVERMHHNLETFYNTMEHDFYGLNLHIIKEFDLNFYISQGVLFISSSLTTEINNPGAHKDLWVPFISVLIQDIFIKRKIPIIFGGVNVYNQYSHLIDESFPHFIIKESISDCCRNGIWTTNNAFSNLNKYLYDNNQDEIMWVNMDVPF